MSPSVPAVPRFQSFLDSSAMAHNPVQVLSKYNAIHGETFRFYFGGVKEAIVTTDPVVIQHVLKTNSDNYHKSEIQKKRMGHFLGKGLLTTEGEPWKTQRRLIQSGFERKQLEVLSSIMQDSLSESLRDFDQRARVGPVDIYPLMMRITFAMVGKSLFGARLKEEDIELISLAISTVQEFMVRQTIQPYLNPWFAVSGELRKHWDLRSRAFGVLDEYLQRRRKEAPGHDLLQILMDARYSDGHGMPDELILSESMQLLVAGHETSSNALSWLLYLLSSHPDCIDRVRDEFDSVLGEKPEFLRRSQVRVHNAGNSGSAAPLSPVLDGRPHGARRRPRRGCRYTPRLDGRGLHLRRAPFAAVLAEPGEFRPGALLQSARKAPHALRPFALRGRPAGLYRRQLRHAAGPHDSECSAPKIRFPSGSRPDHRSPPHGDPATRTRHPHDLHRGHPARRRQTVRLFRLNGVDQVLIVSIWQAPR